MKKLNMPAVLLVLAFSVNANANASRSITTLELTTYTNYSTHLTDQEINTLIPTDSNITYVNSITNGAGHQIVFYTFLKTSATSKALLSTELELNTLTRNYDLSDLLLNPTGSITIGEVTSYLTHSVELVYTDNITLSADITINIPR